MDSDNFQAPFTHSYKLNNGHPIQENANTYVNLQKLVTFSSASRDVLKYPLPSNFKIRLPSPIENVVQLTLYQHSIPIVFDTFSALRNNIELAYTIGNPFKPDGPPLLLNEAIYECLLSIKDDIQIVKIQNGFYNPQQMVVELTNRLNKSVSDNLRIFIEENLPKYGSLLPITEETYDRFVVVYNAVGQNIWFGNRADQFTLNNEFIFNRFKQGSEYACYIGGAQVANRFNEWGLPFFLGLKRINAESEEASFVRFYYGDVNFGDNGLWLTPILGLGNKNVYFVNSTFKIDLLGPNNMYLKINGFNCIDAILPFSIQNQQRVIKTCVDFALAVIPIAATPVTTIYSNNNSQVPVKFFNPPINRIEELDISVVYLNDEAVTFGNSDFTLTLQFTILENTISRKGNTFPSNQGIQPVTLVDTGNPYGRRHPPF